MTMWKRIPNTEVFKVIECDDLPKSLYQAISSGNIRNREEFYKDYQKTRRELQAQGVCLLNSSKKILY